MRTSQRTVFALGVATLWISSVSGAWAQSGATFALADFGIDSGWRTNLHLRFVVDITRDGCADIVQDYGVCNDRQLTRTDVPQGVDHVTDDRAVGDSLGAWGVVARAFATRSRRDHHDSLARHGDPTQHDADS